MFNYIKGKIAKKENNLVVVENGGIGYEIVVSNFTIAKLPPEEENATVYTYLQVKEDGIVLYGFSNLEEKQMFLNLITISGIGPKMAIGILSNIALYDLALAIASQNADILYKVKGIGKKTADRIVLELKEKLTNISNFDTGNTSRELDDAVAVLTGLGISRIDAVKKARELCKADDKAEEIVSKVLKSMS